MRITRRTLQFCLGALWLLDGALQCQSFMFTSAFGRTVIATAGRGQPGFVSHPVHLAATVLIDHPVTTNAISAAVQLGIGLGLMWRRTARYTLIASIVWGLGVWYLGEGFGGLTTGETLLTGAPGAALLYVVVAVIALPDRNGSSSVAPPGWSLSAWAALWLSGAGLQLAAGNNTGSSIAATFRGAGPGGPHWLAHADRYIGRLHVSNDYAAALIAIDIIIAMWALVPGRFRQAAAVTGALLAIADWVLVQGLGDLTTGNATDPNSGPLIMLLAVAVLGTLATPWPWPAMAADSPAVLLPADTREVAITA